MMLDVEGILLITDSSFKKINHGKFDFLRNSITIFIQAIAKSNALSTLLGYIEVYFR